MPSGTDCRILADEFLMESTAVMHPIEEDDNEAYRNDLKACMEKLKEEQRRCVELFYYQQHCYKEIAAELMLEEQQCEKLYPERKTKSEDLP